MKRVTVRVPATTANLGPGFDAFGCALSLYTDVTFEETDCGLEITGCEEAYTGPDNMAYTSFCAVLASMSEEERESIGRKSVAKRLNYTPEIIAEKWKALFEKLYKEKVQNI